MRVLIATATAGAGHLAAAAALEEAWRASRPNDVVKKLDLVEFFSALHRKIHADGYVKLVEHAPEIWGMLFGKTDNPRIARRLSEIKRVFPSKSRSRFTSFVQEFAPDAVVCTHYVALDILGEMRNKPHGRSKTRSVSHPLIASVITDFEAHALWMDRCVDLYCVAAEQTKARLVARGAKPQSVVVTGIPISAKFSSKPIPADTRKAMGLRDDQPIILVLGGGFGMGPVAEILAELDKVQLTFQTVVVAGRNEELRRALGTCDRKHPTHVLGFSSNMHELMAVADLIITKPGGLTTSEALAMGKPLLIINPIPGQEAANSDFLLERGAAAKVNRVEDLPYRIAQLFDSSKLAQMARAAKALGRPRAALDICDEVAKSTELAGCSL
ncbi:MAG TPA: glycosyltransferase [Patescibacteria group bacterium]|nr:glycosyltransferase [Patescibacteria group bacterium]